MDAEASTGAVNVNNIELYYLKFSDADFPTPYKQQRGSVIKYTKIPDYDFESRASWGRSNYTLPPRLRRIISLDDPVLQTSRSVKANVAEHRLPTGRNNRKIIPITEVEEADLVRPRSGRVSERGSPARNSRPGLQSHRAIQVSVYKDSSVGNSISKVTSKNSSRYSDTSANLIKNNKSDVNLSRVNSKSKYAPTRVPLNLDHVKSRYLGDYKETTRRSKTSDFSKSSISNRTVRQNSDEKLQNRHRVPEPPKPTVNYLKRSPDSRLTSRHSSVPSPTVEETEEDTRYPTSVIHVPIDQKYSKKSPPAPPRNPIPRRRLLVSQPTHTQPPHANVDTAARKTPNAPVQHCCKSRCSETDDPIIDEDVDLTASAIDLRPDSCVSVRKVERKELTSTVSERKERVERREVTSSLSERKEIERSDARSVIRWNDAIVVPMEPQYMDQAIDATPAAALTVERSTSATNTEPSAERCDYTETTVGVTMFDDLTIPDLALSKTEQNCPHETLSLPSLKIPDVKIAPMKVATSESNRPSKVPEKGPSKMKDSTSYIIGTLMYTTKQKINIQVVGDKNSTNTLGPVSSFPLSVVSVYKKDLKNYNEETSTRSSQITNKCSFTLDNSLLKCEDNSRLRKPSDIISSITVNKSLLKTEFVSEQFNRELNFIDSFFESLQYLENCSTQGQGAVSGQEKWLQSLEMDHSEYNNFLSKLEDGATEDESDTIMSRSLCLLNLLIRDEQRRAKDLLFVLKMREDALKDYTKSQIIWLENKKKQDNTDISQLKKKQRGALLKLQYECGEMQRMRKALLTLSEKRKTALMKTKKNIELKLTSDVDVDKIISKKKLRRTSSSERTIPVKCFELSSSPEDMLRLSKSEDKDDSSEAPEGSIQAVVSFLSETTPTQTSEKCVAVDGKYLNIVFNDLAMPKIFRSGKQYEVNEEALQNILNSKAKAAQVECVDQFVEHVQCQEDKSTSPSTARSLVEEFNQYYKDFAVGDDDKGSTSPEDVVSDCTNTETLFLVKPQHRPSTISASISATEYTDALSSATLDLPLTMQSVETTTREERAEKIVDVSDSQTGPLPIPAGGEADLSDCQSHADLRDWPVANSPMSISEESSEESIRPSSQPAYSERSSLSALPPLTSLVDCEAERLRLQQIAIEREIKALERQQQCQLIVVRSIPDKPPPPYCAPAEAPRRAFTPEAATEPLICQHMTGTAHPPEDSFDAFVADFCEERTPSNAESDNEQPWSACQQSPIPVSPALTTVIKGACEDLKSVLGTVPPTQVSGLASRRSDHIDDILFAEWRRCEPEWTNLHVDEAVVKNQLFESIFQKVLSETIDEYKVKVLGPEHDEG